MFLTPDNKIRWMRLAFGTAIVCALTVVFMLWFDAPTYLFMRKFDCGLWRAFEYVFDGVVWVVVFAGAVVGVCLKKCLESGIKYKNAKNRFSPIVILADAFAKIKNSYAFFVFTSCLASGVIAKLLKFLIGRYRPVFFEALDLTGFRPFTFEWAFNSMPSGHAAVTFGGLVMIGMLAPRYKWLTWTLATIIGLSRVAMGAHWPSDILFGAFVGMVTADFVKHALAKYRQ